jgi:hypothetical protein
MTPQSATRFRAKLENRSDADSSPEDWGARLDLIYALSSQNVSKRTTS